MGEYLRCLFKHIQENHSGAMRNTAEYQACRAAAQSAWDSLENALSPRRLALVDEYLSQSCRVSVCETEWLFQEAVTLGKWLARLS